MEAKIVRAETCLRMFRSFPELQKRGKFGMSSVYKKTKSVMKVLSESKSRYFKSSTTKMFQDPSVVSG